MDTQTQGGAATLPQLLHGDCLELMQTIPDKSADMVLCDLPYGTVRCEWDNVIPFAPMWEQYKRIIKDNAAIVLFAQEPFATELRHSALKLYKYDWIWKKSTKTGFLNAKKQPLKNHELICVFGKKQLKYNPQKGTGKPYKSKSGGERNNVYGKAKSVFMENSGTRYPVSVQEFGGVNNAQRVHPTQKPVALLEYLIKTYTDAGETVLDNCMGSGSTGVACANTGRKFIGIELNEHYYNVAKERITNAIEDRERQTTLYEM